MDIRNGTGYGFPVLNEVEMRKKLVFMMVYTAMAILAGCAGRRAEVRAAAEKNLDSFTEGNMEEINTILFGTSGYTDTEAGMYEDVRTKGRDGILPIIFMHSTMSVKKVGKDSIELEITAPDMEDIFEYLPDTENGYADTEKGFLEYLEDYAAAAERKKSTVWVPYSIEGERIVIEYYSEEFIRTVTGGFTDAYSRLYMDVLEEYQKGV